MVQGFLARESERVNMSARKTLCKLMAVEICFLAVYFFGKDALNLNDPSYGSIVLFLVVLIGISLALCAVKLTATETKIIDLFMRNLGRIFPAEEIYRRVWNEPAFSAENTVMVHIRRIREKIELNPKEPEYLKVVWGIGYKIEKK